MDVAELDELKDEMEDQQAEMDERQEFFADFANQDQDDLMDELNDLVDEVDQKEAEDIMNGLNMDVGPGKVIKKAPVIVDHLEANEADEEELKKLMMMA